MSLGYPRDLTFEYKQNVYNINLDVSGYDKVTIQAIGTVAAPVYVYGTLNGGDLQSVRDGQPVFATDWAAIQAKKLSDGTMVNSFNAAGLFQVDAPPQYVRIGGGGADIYQLRVFFAKNS